VFALALAAWTYPGAGGYRALPKMNVACCGLPITQKQAEWLKLANGDERLREGMRALYGAFKDAPLLGSLIDPRAAAGDMFAAGFDELEPLLAAALKKERIAASDEATEAMLTASGLAQAARLLSGEYDLVITNTPYLGRGNQDDALKAFCEKHYPHAKQDLANVMLERCLKLCRDGSGVVQFVMPQNWLFLTSYRKQRESLLKRVQWNLLARLGPGAFETITGEVVNVILLTLTDAPAAEGFLLRGIDASAPRTAQDKARMLAKATVAEIPQAEQWKNPDSVVSLESLTRVPRLSELATCCQGTSSADNARFQLCFWELAATNDSWRLLQNAPDGTLAYSGRELVLHWDALRASNHGFAIRGREAWGRAGVTLAPMRNMPSAIYSGQLFTDSAPTIVPKDVSFLPAIYAYAQSGELVRELRKQNAKVVVNNGYVNKVPFDLAYWQGVANNQFPCGLPRPYSDNPVQWIFHGHPCGSVVWDETVKWTAHGPLRTDSSVLQVAVARLLGYRWPAELDDKMELAAEQREWVRRCEALARFADADGIVCIPPVKGERPAADRLLELLAAAYGDAWSPSILDKLLAEAGFAGRTLEDWLRNGFFAQHCKLFHDRPFIWHIWDGERDGFSALVNYHKLDNRTLQALTYTYVGGWIEEQTRRQAARIDGARELVQSALALQNKLKAILEGEKPCDIFVRWKPLAEQPLGWNPDINDGVRLNIRPFMLVGDVGKKEAGVLRDRPNIHWKNDRGTDPVSAPWYDLGPRYGEKKGTRINTHHTTLEEKRRARGGRP
jgi:hypothetical protein